MDSLNLEGCPSLATMNLAGCTSLITLDCTDCSSLTSLVILGCSRLKGLAEIRQQPGLTLWEEEGFGQSCQVVSAWLFMQPYKSATKNGASDGWVCVQVSGL